MPLYIYCVLACPLPSADINGISISCFELLSDFVHTTYQLIVINYQFNWSRNGLSLCEPVVVPGWRNFRVRSSRLANILSYWLNWLNIWYVSLLQRQAYISPSVSPLAIKVGSEAWPGKRFPESIPSKWRLFWMYDRKDIPISILSAGERRTKIWLSISEVELAPVMKTCPSGSKPDGSARPTRQESSTICHCYLD